MNELIKKEFNEIIPKEQIDFLIKFDEMEKRAKVLKDAIKESAKEFLIKNNLTEEGYSQDGIKLSYRKGGTKNIVDTQKLKDEGIYNYYLKESEYEDSVSIKVDYDD